MKYSDETRGVNASPHSLEQCEILARSAVEDETMRALARGIPRSLYRDAMMQNGVYRLAVECARWIKGVTNPQRQEARKVIKHA